MSENTTLILSVLFIVILAIPGLVEKVFNADENPQLRKNIAWASFIGILISGLVTYCSGSKSIQDKITSDKKQDSTSKKNNILRDSLLSLSKKQLDTARTIISLSRELNESQKELILTQNKLISKQQESLNQITGGENKPYVNINFEDLMTPTNLDNYNLSLSDYDKDALRMSYPIDGKNGFPKKLNFTINNPGDTYLKNLKIWVDSYNKFPYLNKSILNDSISIANLNPYFRISREINSRHINEIFRNYEITNLDLNGNRSYYDINVLAPRESKSFIAIPFNPTNDSLLHYKIGVEWFNGSYIMKVFGRIYQEEFYIKYIECFYNGALVKNLNQFFKQKSKIGYNYEYCSTINFQKEEYEIYRNSLNGYIYWVKKDSFYKQYYYINSKSKDNATNLALKRLNEVFGMNKKKLIN